MSPMRDDWLALTQEEALEPDLPILDPHHHLWDDPANRFSPYTLAELRRDTGTGHRVVRTVFMDCQTHYRTDGPPELRPVGEIEYARAVAEESALTPGAEIAGLVGFADMTLGDGAQAVLEAEIVAGGGRFRGIRHSTAWDPSPGIGAYRSPPPGLLLDGTFRRGVACLARLGLSFDALAYHPQLLEVASLARAFPDLTIVLNHTGQPLAVSTYADKREMVFRHWRAGMAELARCPNVFVKLGGVGMPSFGFGWDEQARPPTSLEIAAAIAPYHRALIELFTPARCMFESNFPVDSVSTSYAVLWNAFKRVAAEYSPSERGELFYGAAARAYRL